MIEFFGLFGLFILAIVAAKFVSWLLVTRTKRYRDWVSEQNRLALLETVREVRLEQGDYNVRRTNRVRTHTKTAAST